MTGRFPIRPHVKVLARQMHKNNRRVLKKKPEKLDDILVIWYFFKQNSSKGLRSYVPVHTRQGTRFRPKALMLRTSAGKLKTFI